MLSLRLRLGLKLCAAAIAFALPAFGAAPPGCIFACDPNPSAVLYCPCTLDVSVCNCRASSRDTICTLEFSKEPSEAARRAAGIDPSCVAQCGGVNCSNDMFDCQGLCAAVNPYQMCSGPINSGSRCMTVTPNVTQTYGTGAGLSQAEGGIQLCCANPNDVITGCHVTTAPPHGHGQCHPLPIGGGIGCEAHWICRCPGIEIECGPRADTCQPPRTQCGQNGCCEDGIPCINGACCSAPQTPCTSGSAPVCCPEGMGCSDAQGCCERCPVSCCPSGQSCVNGSCQSPPACPPGRELCPGAPEHCCPEGLTCLDGTTCAPPAATGRKVYLRE